jgi:PAS domain S-box-containing protein
LTVTLLATGLAGLLSLAAAPASYSTPYLLFSAEILAIFWFCGFRQSLLSMLVAVLFVNYFLRPPVGHFKLNLEELLRTVVWLSVAGGLVFLVNKLRESESQARKVLAGITEGFLIVDRNWNLVYINDSVACWAGKPSQELIGRNLREAVPEASGTVVEQHLRRCAAEDVPVQFESRSERMQRWLQVRAYPFPEGISVFLQDISEAKEREERLRSSLDRLVAAHKAAQIGIFEWSVKTNEIIWSEDAYRIHGLTRDQFDGKFETWANNIHPQDGPAVLAKIQKAVENKSEFLVEYREVWPNGETHWYSVHGQVMVNARGEATGMVGICSDVTHRHLEEEALRRAEKLAAAGRLAATIAHEINNPLEAVTNLVYLMRQESVPKLDSRELLRLADEQLARVSHIAKQTLGFYRDSNVPEAVDVAQILEETLAILQSRINAKQISIVREYENACLLNGFRGELRQVFSNLLSNAVDASPLGGSVIVRVKPKRKGEQVVEVHIEIEDFGGGIQPADEAHIFEPFFTTKSDVGTGLGLWITRELVLKNGGSISFRSKHVNDNSGTCFSIVLPGPKAISQTAPLAS